MGESVNTHLVLEERGVHDACVAVGELADVASKEDGLSGLELLHHRLLEVLNLGIHVWRTQHCQ